MSSLLIIGTPFHKLGHRARCRVHSYGIDHALETVVVRTGVERSKFRSIIDKVFGVVAEPRVWECRLSTYGLGYIATDSFWDITSRLVWVSRIEMRNRSRRCWLRAVSPLM